MYLYFEFLNFWPFRFINDTKVIILSEFLDHLHMHIYKNQVNRMFTS